MNRTYLSSNKGFTILEVVFAVSILAIGILGYTSLKISNRYSWVFAKDLTQAVPFSVTQIEGLRLEGYESAAMGGPNLSAVPGRTYSSSMTAALYSASNGGDTLGVGDMPVGISSWGGWLGVQTPNGTPTEKTFVDFAPSTVSWVVKAECPSELSKLAVLTTEWGGGNRMMNIIQVQVRP